MLVTTSIEPPTRAELLHLYHEMLLIRRFEEQCNALFLQGKIPSTLHLYIGQEAVAVGVCSALRPDDFVLGTHRPHGHALAKGVSSRSIMAELFGKVTGCCKAKGGSMHVGDMAVGMFPAIAIVGANAPIAVGSALSAKMRGKLFAPAIKASARASPPTPTRSLANACIRSRPPPACRAASTCRTTAAGRSGPAPADRAPASACCAATTTASLGTPSRRACPRTSVSPSSCIRTIQTSSMSPRWNR